MGRPKKLSGDQLRGARDAIIRGDTAANTAALLNVSRATLFRQLRDMPPLRRVTNAELEHNVGMVVTNHPNVGARLMDGHLRTRRIRAGRQRVLRALRRVRGGVPPRRRLRRRVYSNPGPNSVWHLDSHHKLVMFGIVTHGIIDGFSRYSQVLVLDLQHAADCRHVCRYIVSLRATTDNTSRTAAQLFALAVNEYGVPAHVRCDHGVENYEICQAMVMFRGDRGFIAGPSTRNQRIERLWRDVYEQVSDPFYNYFRRLEEVGILDVNSALHHIVVRALYLRRYQVSHDVQLITELSRA